MIEDGFIALKARKINSAVATHTQLSDNQPPLLELNLNNFM